MYMIEISEDKVSNLAENVEKALSCMGKVMQCVNSLKDEEDDSQYVSNYRTGYREEDYPRRRSHRRYDDEEERYSGRYSRM